MTPLPNDNHALAPSAASTMKSRRLGTRVPFITVLNRIACELRWGVDDPELLQKTELVEVVPAFDKLAINGTVDGGTRKGHRVAGWRHAPPLPPVGTTIGPAVYDHVPFGDCVLDSKVTLPGSDEAGEIVFVVFAIANAGCRNGATGIMEDEAWDEHFFEKPGCTKLEVRTSVNRKHDDKFEQRGTIRSCQ